jgi:hypothetical protein
MKGAAKNLTWKMNHKTRPTLSYEWDTKRGKAISRTATATSMEKSGERSYFAVAVGLLLMSAIAADRLGSVRTFVG